MRIDFSTTIEADKLQYKCWEKAVVKEDFYIQQNSFQSEDEIKNLFTHMEPRAVVPSSFGTKDQFHIRWFFQGLGVRGMVLEWFKHIEFIIHFTSNLWQSQAILPWL